MEIRTDLRQCRSLIAELDELFPRPMFGSETSVDLIRFECGKRALVELLKEELRRQDESDDTLPQVILGNRDV